MPIVPDTKNWTWVLTRPCPECGFDGSTFPSARVAAAVRENSSSWRTLLDHPWARTRPDDATWSALEYGCHVRDVFRVYDRRLHVMLTHDYPLFQNWDQDQTAVEDHYSGQELEVVAGEIEASGHALAERFDAVPDDGWSRRGRRSDGATFTVESFARYLLHDPVHHVYDVQRGYERLSAERPDSKS